MLSFSSCIGCGFDSYTVLFKCPQRNFLWGHGGGREIFSGGIWKVRYTNQNRTRWRNWRTTSATQLQPSKSQCYIGYTSTLWQHHCWLTVQTLYAIYIITPERISQGHVQNGMRANFSWPILYIFLLQEIYLCLNTLCKICTSGEILWSCYWTFDFDAIGWISWLCGQLSSFHDGFFRHHFINVLFVPIR